MNQPVNLGFYSCDVQIRLNHADKLQGLAFLICSDVIGLPSRDIAPSATMITFRREPLALCCRNIWRKYKYIALHSERRMWRCFRADWRPINRHTYIREPPAQVVLPVVIWWHLWNEHPVGTTGQSCHQGQVPGCCDCFRKTKRLTITM